MSKVNELPLNGQVLPPTKLKCGFTQISNVVLLDERLSFKARGILALLLSRPADWRIYLSEVADRSSKDGKKAIQSGFKELAEAGYLQLTAFVNKETGQFEGKGYTICKKAIAHRQRPLRTVLKTDNPISGHSPKRIDLKSDRPKTASYSNTKSSNTKNTNTKKQQHQKESTHRIDAAGFEKNEKDIRLYYPTLSNDAAWQSLYVSTAISTRRQLSLEELYLLMVHFKSTSLKAGATYTNVSQVKKHFANWFQANLSNKTLLQFIREGQKTEQQAKALLFPLITKVNDYFDTLIKRRCVGINQVKELKEYLIAANEKLALKRPLLSKATERESIGILQSDISKMLTKLNNATIKKQLDWFCQKAAPAQSALCKF